MLFSFLIDDLEAFMFFQKLSRYFISKYSYRNCHNSGEFVTCMLYFAQIPTGFENEIENGSLGKTHMINASRVILCVHFVKLGKLTDYFSISNFHIWN